MAAVMDSISKSSLKSGYSGRFAGIVQPGEAKKGRITYTGLVDAILFGFVSKNAFGGSQSFCSIELQTADNRARSKNTKM